MGHDVLQVRSRRSRRRAPDLLSEDPGRQGLLQRAFEPSHLGLRPRAADGLGAPQTPSPPGDRSRSVGAQRNRAVSFPDTRDRLGAGAIGGAPPIPARAAFETAARAASSGLLRRAFDRGGRHGPVDLDRYRQDPLPTRKDRPPRPALRDAVRRNGGCSCTQRTKQTGRSRSCSELRGGWTRSPPLSSGRCRNRPDRSRGRRRFPSGAPGDSPRSVFRRPRRPRASLSLSTQPWWGDRPCFQLFRQLRGSHSWHRPRRRRRTRAHRHRGSRQALTGRCH